MAEITNQIIPYYAHPHVFTVINDNTFYDEAVGEPVDEEMPYSTLVIAGADQGIDNTLIRCNDLTTKKSMFGSANFDKYGQASLQAEQLFNGRTSVWFMRVLPDNATYANLILLAKYRKGNDLDDLGQETGLKRLEIKFEVAYAAKPYITSGANDVNDILDVAESLASDTADPTDGYLCVPVAFARATGRGKYGNRFGLKVARDADAENEYETKMYMWSLIQNTTVSAVTNVFAGSLYQTSRNNESTLISDVTGMFDEGACPIDIYPFEDNFDKLYEFYQAIVEENAEYLGNSGASEDQMADLDAARDITEAKFDPLFGYVYNTKTDEIIPYYKNYTVKSTGAYVAPDKEVATASAMPTSTEAWNTAAVGNTVVVLADENNGGYRWKYTVTAINAETGAITYDEGVECYVDDKEYDGVDITVSSGIGFIGGSDGDFESITVNGTTRKPTKAEMKILLAREQVKAFRGKKDRRILSPSMVNLDFIFDANYNITNEGGFNVDDGVEALYSGSSVLTDSDYKELALLVSQGTVEATDLNVKKAIYDLNEFRNRNGMPNAPDEGAGCSVYFDCGTIGIKNSYASDELLDIANRFDQIVGRANSIDLGCYDIFEPYTGKKVTVTVTYFLAQQLIPHIIANGLNKPFTGKFTRLTAIQRSQALTSPNSIIRDSFRPAMDLIDWDIKEALFKQTRINYWEIVDGRYIQRAVQNTRQLDASALLEENNVRVLNTLKKGLERANRDSLFDWNDPIARAGYTKAQNDIYKPWIGTLVEDLTIDFRANRFEQKRMMMHCYVDVKFRDIIKRIILQIDINRPTYSEEGGE